MSETHEAHVTLWSVEQPCKTSCLLSSWKVQTVQNDHSLRLSFSFGIHIRSSSLFSCHRILPCNSYTWLRDSSAGVDIHTDLPSLPQTHLQTITHARTYMSIQRNCLQPHIGSSKSSPRIINFENLGYPRSASAARNLTSSDTCIEIGHQRCDVCVVARCFKKDILLK